MSAEQPVVLVVGAATRDLTRSDPRGWRLGGAVTYISLTLARLGLAVRTLVGADALAAEAAELSILEAAGCVLAVAPLASGPVFENLDTPNGRRQRCVATSQPVMPTMLPRNWTSGHAAIVFAPVAGELDGAWAGLAGRDDSGARPALAALGWQGLLRRLEAGIDVERLAPAPHALLNASDLVVASIEDVGPDVRLRELVDLVRPGATLVITRGDRGGTALTSRRPRRSVLRTYPAIPSNGIVEPTGAGDVFLAALVATAIDGARLGAVEWPDRLSFAAAAGSLAVEGLGLAGVPTLAAMGRRVSEVA